MFSFELNTISWKHVTDGGPADGPIPKLSTHQQRLEMGEIMSYYQQRKAQLESYLVETNRTCQKMRHRPEPKLAYYEIDEIAEMMPKPIKRYGLKKFVKKLRSL